MESELKSMLTVTLFVTTAMTYARFVSSRTNPGSLRLLALLPFLPFSFQFSIFRGSSGFVLGWLALFKLLLLSFILCASLPVKLNNSNSKKPNTSPQRLFIYLFLDVFFACVPALLEFFFPGGVELVPQFDAPLSAKSLQEFWGRRWNLIVVSILRPSVYDPVRRRHGAVAGVLATFLVSGMVHEVMFYYCNLAAPDGRVTAFFVLHGLCVVGEVMARRAGWWDPPATLGFVAVTAFWLFVPALLRNRLIEMGMVECKELLDFVAGGFVAPARVMGFLKWD